MIIYHGHGLKLPLVLNIVLETRQWNLWLCTDPFLLVWDSTKWLEYQTVPLKGHSPILTVECSKICMLIKYFAIFPKKKAILFIFFKLRWFTGQSLRGNYFLNPNAPDWFLHRII